MTIHTLNMPDATPELAQWLESQFMSDRLGELVAELRAVQPPEPAARPSLKELLGDDESVVLQKGLTALSEAKLRSLLRHPDRLLELQELALARGGDYWRNVPRPDSLAKASQRNWQTLQTKLDSPATTKPRVSFASPQSSTSRRTWLMTAAALFLCGVGLGWFINGTASPSTALAWNRPEALQPPVNRQEYLTRLADLANDWFQERPKTPTALANRLLDFRRGCTQLQLHPDNIPIEDRKWLIEDCRKWADKLDQHLATLEQGQPVETVQTAVDETIHKLINKLRQKSQPA